MLARKTSAFVTLFAFLPLGGCSKAPFEVAPAAGRVTIDGEPFSSGKVMFAPVAKQGEINAGRAAMAPLERDGSFTLGTYKIDDGAVVGEHWVTIISTGQDSGNAASRRVPKFDRFTVPTGTFTVVAGQENRFDIEISAEQIRRFGRSG